MENNKKYLLLRLEERNGEYEYTHRSVHEIIDGEIVSCKHLSKTFFNHFIFL